MRIVTKLRERFQINTWFEFGGRTYVPGDNWENVLDPLAKATPTKYYGERPIISDSNRDLSGVCRSLVCAVRL